ncbi:MAG: hypothetical protein ABSD74_00820 [Rhizomicrobium sp.]
MHASPIQVAREAPIRAAIDSGEIVGWSIDKRDVYHGFLGTN